MSEQPEKFYSRGAKQFAQNYSIENMPEAYIGLLDEFSEKVNEGKVLDAGCGPGRDTQYLTEKGLNVTGIDLAEGMIQHAKENKKGKFRLMNVKDLEFPKNEFDGIWCNTVIHFFPPEQMPEVIGELKRVLKPGGTVYISLKIGNGTFMREKYDNEVKQYLVTEEKARKMIQEKGLEIKQVNTAEISGPTIMNFLTEAK